jgi:hypothetical protein
MVTHFCIRRLSCKDFHLVLTQTSQLYPLLISKEMAFFFMWKFRMGWVGLGFVASVSQCIGYISSTMPDCASVGFKKQQRYCYFAQFNFVKF